MYNERTYYTVLTVVFISVIAALMLVNLITPDQSYSASENRYLEPRPAFSWDKLRDGRYTTAFEKYVSDQFILRDYWVGTKTDVDRLMGKNENNGVYLGQDGYLIQKFTYPASDALDSKMQQINKIAAQLPDSRRYFLLVPNATKILADKLPLNAPQDDQLIFMQKVKQKLNQQVSYIDIYPTLYQVHQENIYYKTDHHWTTTGAYYAYQLLGREMGFTAYSKDAFKITRVTDSFYGSLYSKSGFRHLQPDNIELYLPRVPEQLQVKYVDYKQKTNSVYFMNHLNDKDKYQVFLGGNQSLIVISNNAAAKKNLLIIKDSYANSLIPFLTSHYRNIYVVDLRYFRDDISTLTRQQHFDDVLMLYNVNTFIENN